MSDVLISFLFLAVTRTFSKMLNRSGESGHLFLASDFGGTAFSCLLLSTLAVGFSHMALVMVRYILSIPNLFRVYIMKGY